MPSRNAAIEERRATAQRIVGGWLRARVLCATVKCVDGNSRCHVVWRIRGASTVHVLAVSRAGSLFLVPVVRVAE